MILSCRITLLKSHVTRLHDETQYIDHKNFCKKEGKERKTTNTWLVFNTVNENDLIYLIETKIKI